MRRRRSERHRERAGCDGRVLHLDALALAALIRSQVLLCMVCMIQNRYNHKIEKLKSNKTTLHLLAIKPFVSVLFILDNPGFALSGTNKQDSSR